MLKNQIKILSVKKSLKLFGNLVGKTNPEYQIMSYLLKHFYQNEILEISTDQIAQRLNLDPQMTKAFIERLVKARVLIAKDGIFYLNTDFVLNR